MKIKNILVSQPIPVAPEKSPFSDIVEKHGVSVDFNPFIKVEGVTPREFRQQRIDILAHTAIIFTSRTAIDHFFRICEEVRVTLPETMKYFCTTEAIALYLQKYIVYRKRKIFFGTGSFADLMPTIVKHKEEKFLVPLSDPHKPEISKLLDKNKIKYDKAILSRTVASDDLDGVELSKYDMLVFYSPNEISVLEDKFPEAKNTHSIAVFGTGTAKAASDAGYTISVLAPTPEAPSMVLAIAQFMDKAISGEQVKIELVVSSEPQEVKKPRGCCSTKKNAKTEDKTKSAAKKVTKKATKSTAKKSQS